MPSYTRTALLNSIFDTVIEKNANLQLDTQDVANFAVREVLGDIDLRSTKRLSGVIDMFENIYDYTCPPDLKGIKVIDLVPQVNRRSNYDIELTTPEEFDRRKTFDQKMMTFNDHDFLRKFRASIITNSVTVTLSSFDSLSSGGGQWVATGDAQNLRIDTQNFVEGSGSLLFDIGIGGTGDGGVQNTTLNSTDITSFLLAGSIFVYVYIQSVTGLTNFEIEIGSDTSDYYMQTVTQTNEANAFTLGWNLLRFDFSAMTKVGNPLSTNTTYIQLTENSSPAITSSPNWRFDGLIMSNGNYNQILYYSKYLWQDASTLAYKENSTASGDFLVCDTEEFNMIVNRGRMEKSRRLRDWNAYEIDKGDYQEDKTKYIFDYPSEAKMLTQTYYDTAASLSYDQDLDVIIENSSDEDNLLQ